MNMNRKLYYVILMMGAVIVALVMAMTLMIRSNKASNDKATDTKSTVENVVEDEADTKSNGYGESDFFTDEVASTGNDIEYCELKFVIDGFEFTCPPEYECSYYDEVGPVVCVDDAFVMKIVVRDGSNSEAVKDKEKLTSKTIDAGGTITKDVTKTKVNGREYTYFRMELMGDKTLVAFAPAPGDKKRFGGQIVVENENLTDEELLSVFDKIVTSAVETDKPNSTADEIFSREVFVAPGEQKTSSTLKLKENKIEYSVPDKYYSTYMGEEENFAIESFATANIEITADVYYYPEDPGFGGIDEYMSMKVADVNTLSDGSVTPKVQTDKMDGREIKYFVTSYEHNGSATQKCVGVVELKNGGFFVVEAVATDEELTITWEDVRGFFEIK